MQSQDRSTLCAVVLVKLLVSDCQHFKFQAGWEDFAADYFPTLIDRKFRGFVSESKVRRAFFMRITSESKV